MKAQLNIMTVDLEEWFHAFYEADSGAWDNLESRINRNTDYILDVFTKHDVGATFFIVGWIARKYPELVKRIAGAGFDIGSHSDMHKVAFGMSKQGFMEDVKRSVSTLEEIICCKVKSYRAPFFSITESVIQYLETLHQLQIEVDSSICPCKTVYSGYPNFPEYGPCFLEIDGWQIKEIPVSTTRFLGQRFIYSGGGYFRLLPGWLIKRCFQSKNYNHSYFHPRDFDVVQPDYHASLVDNIKRKIGVSGARQKFEMLASLLQFTDIQSANKLIDWSEAPVVKISPK
ncbi:polysaccharide deacetylase family protein [Foetidibacter luteolus]|uniref:polysaccharide deacetylase family protein n=1 Tax=Foetidibacter luteolus TaxID=2608880 RepID=UPI00129A50FC|nr:polysaccharide deacetylase family protein [Foetidibacter luteolus]